MTAAAEPAVKRARSPRRFGPSLGPWLCLLPALALLVPFLLFPLALIVRYSFNVDEAGALVVWTFTLDNYARILSDPYYLETFANSLAMAFGIALATAIIGYPLAYFLVRWSDRSRSFLLWAVYTPLIVSVIVRVFGWIVITADTGLINNALLSLGLITKPVHILFEVEGLTIGLIHRYLPLMVLPLVNAIAKIDDTLAAASASLGAGTGRTFLKVVLPLSLPGIVSGTQLVVANVLSDFVLPSLMGTTRFRLIAPTLYDEAMARANWATAATLAAFVLVLVGIVLVGTNAAMRRLAPWARTL